MVEKPGRCVKLTHYHSVLVTSGSRLPCAIVYGVSEFIWEMSV